MRRRPPRSIRTDTLFPSMTLFSSRGQEWLLRLEEVEATLGSGVLVVDACRGAVRGDDTAVSLARRPVLLALARALGEAWPEDLSRDALVRRARSEEHTSELPSLMRNSYAVFSLKKNTTLHPPHAPHHPPRL